MISSESLSETNLGVQSSSYGINNETIDPIEDPVEKEVERLNDLVLDTKNLNVGLVDDLEHITNLKDNTNDVISDNHDFNDLDDDEEAEAEDKCNLIINYLPQDMTETKLLQIFEEHGKIRSTKVVRGKVHKKCVGYGFVLFSKEVDAKSAIESKNGFSVGNKKLKVSFARPSSDAIRNCKLYITNLPKQYTDEMVKNLFAKYGDIIECRILREQDSSENKGVAFIQYANKEQSDEALIALNRQLLSGGDRALNIKYAEGQIRLRGRDNNNTHHHNSNNNNINNGGGGMYNKHNRRDHNVNTMNLNQHSHNQHQHQHHRSSRNGPSHQGNINVSPIYAMAAPENMGVAGRGMMRMPMYPHQNGKFIYHNNQATHQMTSNSGVSVQGYVNGGNQRVKYAQMHSPMGSYMVPWYDPAIAGYDMYAASSPLGMMDYSSHGAHNGHGHGRGAHDRRHNNHHHGHSHNIHSNSSYSHRHPRAAATRNVGVREVPGTVFMVSPPSIEDKGQGQHSKVTVSVNNLPPNCDVGFLYDLFAPYGRIHNAEIDQDDAALDDVSGCRGNVILEGSARAQHAVHALHGAVLYEGSRPLMVNVVAVE